MRELSDSEQKALAEAQRLMAEIAEAIRVAFILALPWVIRLAALAICGCGVSVGFYRGWLAFGGDVAAIIPAAAIALIPLALVMNYSLGLGGFVFAGLVSGLAGYGLQTMPAWARVLALSSMAGIGIAAQFHKGEQHEGDRATGADRRGIDV